MVLFSQIHRKFAWSESIALDYCMPASYVFQWVSLWTLEHTYAKLNPRQNFMRLINYSKNICGTILVQLLKLNRGSIPYYTVKIFSDYEKICLLHFLHHSRASFLIVITYDYLLYCFTWFFVLWEYTGHVCILNFGYYHVITQSLYIHQLNKLKSVDSNLSQRRLTVFHNL